ncbi:hypothetical protein FO519_009262 [Halicephalobus sp. NKZ332]|nr:hypothetical protein FO519_009262 [Halicephalobus sp. NKZ332]
MTTIPTLDNFYLGIKTNKEFIRALTGEFAGTSLLVFIIDIVGAQQTLPTFGQSIITSKLSIGLVVALGIVIARKTSGSHINPAVIVAMLTLQQIKVVTALLYILAQLIGAFVGAAIAYFFCRSAINDFDGGIRHVTGTQGTAHIFSSYLAPHLSICGGLADQIIGTAILVFCIIHVVDCHNNYPSWVQPFIVGLVFMIIETVSPYNTEHSLNPACDLGPRLFTLVIGYGKETFSFREYSWFWVPVLGPILGGIIAGNLYRLFLRLSARPEDEYEIITRIDHQPSAER